MACLPISPHARLCFNVCEYSIFLAFQYFHSSKSTSFFSISFFELITKLKFIQIIRYIKHLFTLFSCFIGSVLPVFAQEQATTLIPDSFHAFRFEDVFQTEEDFNPFPNTITGNLKSNELLKNVEKPAHSPIKKHFFSNLCFIEYVILNNRLSSL